MNFLPGIQGTWVLEECLKSGMKNKRNLGERTKRGNKF